ncbi:hypothetical protein PFDG_02024 [Plasmodium falciparum Dd2]|uniref:Rifin n=1 Tax=Plasmodium falciparum (isolate Dd2) TaxID=57267 RepID=A0A0L7M0S5_PLAF4|nr:hypothetical protein PFDG_02024 [Plasmodium falciparum Dd2]
MKVHYFNIFLFSLSLNILLLSSQVHTQRNHNLTLHKPTSTSRLLCNCELYEPSNYDNDPEMKAVMQGFDRQTSQRFEEYNERLLENKQKCREQCDKEIQKIILKDKLEKELMDKFATLQTDIQNDAIPTCVCEKSLADKVEKGCLKCAQNLGGIVVPSSGVLGGIGEFGLSVWKPAALAAAKKAAIAEGLAAGEAAGIEAGKKLVIQLLQRFHIDKLVSGICEEISRTGHYANITNFTKTIIEQRGAMCGLTRKLGEDMCKKINIGLGTRLQDGISQGLPDSLAVPKVLKGFVAKAETNANYEAAKVSSKIAAEITKEKTSEIAATYASYEIAIIASIVAIVVIVLIMAIIYLILRYRRKKKMKKKLQYIKLLEE